MRRRPTTLFIVASAIVGVSACSAQTTPAKDATGTSAVSTQTTSATPTPTQTPVRLTFAPAADEKGVLPTTPVRVSATDGTLTSATVTAPDGSSLPGALKDGVWTTTARKVPSTTYTIRAVSTRSDGSTQTDTSTFTTLKPAIDATYHVLYDNTTVGVGAPVSIQFDSAVQTKEMRAAIEKNAVVTTTPKVEGSWGWLDNRQLMWRPAQYWKPGTKVDLKANLAGLQSGEGKWISRNGTGTFTVGRSMISTVDIPAHTMTVTRDGKVVDVFPISAGSGKEPRFVTRSGTKVIIEKNGDMTMDSESVGITKGDPNYYKVETKWNLRVTWTGEFLHSAPWSVGSQGVANVSHGCVNMRPSQARWMFENSMVGDVVKFTGSNRPFLPTEGIGVWEYTYDQWKKQSALVD